MALGVRRWPKVAGGVAIAVVIGAVATAAILATGDDARTVASAPPSAPSTTAATATPAAPPTNVPAPVAAVPAPAPATAAPAPVAAPAVPAVAVPRLGASGPDIDVAGLLAGADPALLDQLDGQLAMLAASSTGARADAVAQARDAVATLKAVIGSARSGAAVDGAAVQDAIAQFTGALVQYSGAAGAPVPGQ